MAIRCQIPCSAAPRRRISATGLGLLSTPIRPARRLTRTCPSATLAVKSGLTGSGVRTGEFVIGAVPAAPTSLAATPESSTQINLTWINEADNEQGFRIKKGMASGVLTLHATVATPGLQSYSVTG